MTERLLAWLRPSDHLAVSHVRFYLLRFNSSGNFCNGGANCSREEDRPGSVPAIASPVLA